MNFNSTDIIYRKVGAESSRTHYDKGINGFYQKYMNGTNGLDIGYSGYSSGSMSILPTAIGVDTDYPGYDGIHLPFEDSSQDYVYSSHTLEHINNYKEVIKEWYRVLKVGGYMITIVPHQFLYERKKNLPSEWNSSHFRFYSPASLLKEFEESLEPNSYRIRLLEDGDKNYNYDIPLGLHPDGQYEITLVIQKINKPNWGIR